MKKIVLGFLVSLLALPAIAGPDTCEWAGMNTWNFAHGSTPYIFSCNTSNNQSAAATAWAEAQCQAAWDNFASSYSDTGYFDVSLSLGSVTWDPNLLRWNYSCRTCVDGFLPAFGVVHLERVSLAQAGGSATDLVAGEVMSLDYHMGDDGNDGEGGHYLVDVWGSDGMVQVRVDGTSGRASVVRDDEEAVCRD